MDMKQKPFYLSDEDIAWVQQTLLGMTEEEKIGQIFCTTGMMTDPKELSEYVTKYHPGGFMYRTGDGADIQEGYRALQQASKIPMLLAANLESGGNGVATQGTHFAKEMQVAATDDTEMAYKLGMVCGREGSAVGCNWAFAPIVDIDMNWRNPITNVRTFGSDPKRVQNMASAYMKGVAETGEGMVVCIKHFPGDGVDERDQHLLSSVNSLSVEEWENTYGKVYQRLIDEGAQTVMVGHIHQPAMTRKLCPTIRDEDMLPASTSKILMTDLLRGQMGFQGLITTDATPMLGFTGTLTRKEAVQTALMAGADMILFCKSIDEDYQAIRDGLRDGKVTGQRLNEAVLRILATKASMKLHQKQAKGTLIPTKERLQVLGCQEHETWAKQCAHQAITLVKDNQQLLPISPAKTPRIRLTVLGEQQSGSFGDNGKIGELLRKALEREGFTVSVYDYATMEHGEIFESGVEDMKRKFDLSLIAANVATGSNNTTRRLDWIPLMAANEPWYVKEIPTMFVSFANPYHMIDAPFISTFVNCYSSNCYCVDAFVDKIMGRSTFEGKSPVDVWCGGIWGAKFM